MIDVVLKLENILVIVSKYFSFLGKESFWFFNNYIMFIFSCYVYI